MRILTVLVLGLTVFRLGNARTFVDSAGRSIDAEMVKVEGSQVTISKSDNQQEYTLPITRFSDEDQVYILGWAEQREREGFLPTRDARFDVFVSFKRKDKLDLRENYDDRVQTFYPSVQISNGELYRSFNEIDGLLIMLGESVLDKEQIKVLSKQTVEIPHTPRQGEAVWEGNGVRTEYDNKNYAQFGYKYEGYILALRNRDGEIIYLKASVSRWELPWSALERLTERTVYDRNLSREVDYARY